MTSRTRSYLTNQRIHTPTWNFNKWWKNQRTDIPNLISLSWTIRRAEKKSHMGWHSRIWGWHPHVRAWIRFISTGLSDRGSENFVQCAVGKESLLNVILFGRHIGMYFIRKPARFVHTVVVFNSGDHRILQNHGLGQTVTRIQRPRAQPCSPKPSILYRITNAHHFHAAHDQLGRRGGGWWWDSELLIPNSPLGDATVAAASPISHRFARELIFNPFMLSACFSGAVGSVIVLNVSRTIVSLSLWRRIRAEPVPNWLLACADPKNTFIQRMSERDGLLSAHSKTLLVTCESVNPFNMLARWVLNSEAIKYWAPKTIVYHDHDR